MQTLKEKADILLGLLTNEAIALNPIDCGSFVEIALEFYYGDGNSMPIELGELYQKNENALKYNSN